MFWLAFQILQFMQWCGWPVDAQARRATFLADPLAPQVLWLAALAVTNLLQVFEVRNGKFLNASAAYYYQDAWQKELNYRRGIEETEGVHFFYLK